MTDTPTGSPSTIATAMAKSGVLADRIRSRAALQGKDIDWGTDNRLLLIAKSSDWATAWTTALTAVAGADPAAVGDLGARSDVVTDTMLDTAITALIAEQAADAQTAADETAQQIAALQQQNATLSAQVAQLLAAVQALSTAPPTSASS